MKERIDAQASIASQSSTTLAILLAGVGGFLAYAMKVFDPDPSPQVWGAAAVCVYLALLAVLLLVTCVRLRDGPALHNEPRNLVNEPSATLEQLRAGEILQIQLRIDEQTRITASRARSLDRVRWLAAATPAVFVLAAWAASNLLQAA